MDVDAQQLEVAAAFDKKWEAQEIPGQGVLTEPNPQGNSESTGIWCGACKHVLRCSIYQLEFLTTHLGQKHYSKQTVYDAHLTSKKHIKAVAKQAASGEPAANPNGSAPPEQSTNQPSQSSAKIRFRNSAYYTYLTTDLLVSLVSTLNETKSNVERRFSLTAREREQELLDQAKPAPAPAPAADGAGEEDEEEERIYNPLKLPLGWDGKPIPYWLYKLHGLGVEYRCEICSDHVYMGRYAASIFWGFHILNIFYRKNFDRHFQVRYYMGFLNLQLILIV